MSTIKTYRKKPVEIQAVIWTGENLIEVTEFMQGNKIDALHPKWDDYAGIVSENGLTIHTLEGEMKASIGDYIIKGMAGEYYPCKPDIFNKTYEEVPVICPKCGEELVMCENCENVGCPDCDGYITTRDDVLLCAECGAAIQAEWEKQTENGTRVCGTCAHFKDEDVEGDGWCDKDQMVWHCSYYCKDYLPKEGHPLKQE